MTNSICSMTAYASCQQQFTNFGQVSCEIKSVNSRFLDLSIRLPDYLSQLESALRKSVSNVIKRGKVELSLYIKLDQEFKAGKLYKDQISDYLDLYKYIKQVILESDSNSTNKSDGIEVQGLAISDLIKNLTSTAQYSQNKIILENLVSQDFMQELQGSIIYLVEQGLNKLLAERQREGDVLKTVLLNIVKKLRSDTQKLEELLPQTSLELKNKYKQKLSDTMFELLAEPSIAASTNDKLTSDLEIKTAQEIAVYLNKADISEELARLKLHIDEVENILVNLPEEALVGRRLDFLMQELMRETNTLSAKAVNIDFRNIAINLKVYIEQMREQIQNIE